MQPLTGSHRGLLLLGFTLCLGCFLFLFVVTYGLWSTWILLLHLVWETIISGDFVMWLAVPNPFNPRKGLLFPLPLQCPPFYPCKGVVALGRVEGSLSSLAPVLH